MDYKCRQVMLTRLYESIEEYAKINGSMEVHRSWRDTMIEQGRKVSDDRMIYDKLDHKDKLLDATIAKDVIKDFLVWFENHK